MRNGVLGAILALTAGAGMAWGQYPPGSSLSGSTPSVIPPQLPGMAGAGAPSPFDPYSGAGYPAQGGPGYAPPGGPGYPPQGGPGGPPQGGPTYPPQANWDAFNLNGSNGSSEGYIPHWWVSVEYLMWFPKSANINTPIATSGDVVNAGAAGNASTQLLYGMGHQPYDLDSGYRISGGAFLDSDGRLGFALSGFQMETHSRGFSVESGNTGSPLLARPFFDTFTGANSSFVVAAPGYGTGQIYAIDTLNVFGAEGNIISTLYRSAPDGGFGYSLGVFGGFRFMAVDENVNIGTNSQLFAGSSATINNQTFTTTTTTGVNVNAGTTTTATTINAVGVQTLDQYNVRNEFYGGNFGLFQQFQFDRYFLAVNTKIALGDVHQVVNIVGASNVPITTTNGVSVVNAAASTINTAQGVTNNLASSGLLAQSGLIGHYARDVFGVVPELNLAFGYQFTPALSGFIGYNMIYMSNVVRPYNLISGSANSAAQPVSSNFGLPSAVNQPINPFTSSGFWIQGINVGLTFRY